MIAILFDAENISADNVSKIIESISMEGTIISQRAYADWSIQNTKSWKEALNKTPIIAIQQFHHDEKQAIDKKIIMDAIEMAIKHEEIDCFAIVASDNGYFSLALKLRELGKRVIGVGEKNKCNSIWVKSCNKFIYIEDLVDKDEFVLLDANGKDEDSELNNYSLEKFLENAYEKTPYYKSTSGKLVSQMWESIYALKSDFNVKNFGAKRPIDLLKKFENKFKITDDGKNQRTFFVEKIENENESLRKTGIVKRRIRNYRIITADDNSGDYFFYMSEINPEFKGEKVDKGTKVDFLVVNSPDNNGGFENKNGRATDLKIIE